MLTTDIIERAASQNLADFVSAFEVVAPEVRAAALKIGGGIAVFTGIESPLSTIKGLGPDLTDNNIHTAEEFFRAHGAEQVTFELAPWVDGPAIERLQRRGYRAAGSESVVVRAVPPETTASDGCVRLVEPDRWAELALDVSELPREEFSRALMRASAHLADALNLAAEDERGAVVACAQLAPAGEVAIFGNDDTHPDARRRGYQRVLIEARLGHARRLSFTHAIAEVAPGSTSERNYLRCGFERVYIRTHYSREIR